MPAGSSSNPNSHEPMAPTLHVMALKENYAPWYTSRVIALKSTSYDRELALTPYLDMPYPVAFSGGYVASIQMMLRDKLKQLVK